MNQPISIHFTIHELTKYNSSEPTTIHQTTKTAGCGFPSLHPAMSKHTTFKLSL